LTDLIFGLALSIGAVGLLNYKPATTQDLVLSVSLFLFSFLILISIWLRYTETMSALSVETSGTRTLNIILLFFVAIEPYLFNLIGSPSVPLDIASTAYALDIGSVYIILASFNSILSSEHRHLIEPAQLRKYRALRNIQLLVVAVFWISVLPQFYTFRLRVGGADIPVRFLLWIATFAFPRGMWILRRTGRLELPEAKETKNPSST
jgi:uncharacterized membrane protein